MQIRELMNGPVLSVTPMSTATEAAQLMRDHDTGDVVVTDEGRLTGILTDRDVAVRLVAQGLDGDTPVSEIYTDSPVTIEPDASLEDAAQLMRERAIRRLPVCENDDVVGFVSLGDLAQYTDSDATLQEISSASPDS